MDVLKLTTFAVGFLFVFEPFNAKYLLVKVEKSTADDSFRKPNNIETNGLTNSSFRVGNRGSKNKDNSKSRPAKGKSHKTSSTTKLPSKDGPGEDKSNICIYIYNGI